MKVTTFYRNSKGNYTSKKCYSKGGPVVVGNFVLVNELKPITVEVIQEDRRMYNKEFITVTVIRVLVPKKNGQLR